MPHDGHRGLEAIRHPGMDGDRPHAPSRPALVRRRIRRRRCARC